MTEFPNFATISQDDVSALAVKSMRKSCSIDPLPACVLKKCFSVLLPVLTNIVNRSLSSGTMPDHFKIAALIPTLKKPGADFTEFESFRPLSNLKFVSKLVEKAASFQLSNYITTNYLSELFQSAYISNHSTETALLKVKNDILRALDRNESVFLLLLHLSVAFHTVDHSQLLSRLSFRFGIKGTVLQWLTSYLNNRLQFVQVDGGTSNQHVLACGVPQGSVLGPLLYILYTSPIAEIKRRHNLQYHLYTDDTQIYITLIQVVLKIFTMHGL